MKIPRVTAPRRLILKKLHLHPHLVIGIEVPRVPTARGRARTETLTWGDEVAWMIQWARDGP